MKKGKKNTTKKIQQKKNNYNSDIIGTIIVAIAILSMFSLFSLKMGIVGSLIRRTSFSLLGFGAYLLPLILISIGLVFIIDKFDSREGKFILSLLIFFVSILIILDVTIPFSYSLPERISNSIILSKTGKGGGIFGSFFGFFFYRLFGSIGSYIVLGFIIIINILLITNTKIKDIISRIFNKSKKILNENTKPKINNKVPVNSNHEDIRILDYTKNSKKDSKKTIDIKEEIVDIDSEIEIKQNTNNINTYTIPSLSLLKSPVSNNNLDDQSEILNNANIIQDTMKNFGIDAKILEINVGPTITCYELQPSPGIKLSRIVSLSDNIALSLASSDIRIEDRKSVV